MLNCGLTVPFWTKQTQRTIVMCAIDLSLIGMIATVAIKSHTRELEIQPVSSWNLLVLDCRKELIYNFVLSDRSKAVLLLWFIL